MKELRVPVGEARKNLAGLIRRANNGARVKLTRYGHTLAGLISLNDLLQLKQRDAMLRRPAQTRRASVRRNGRTVR